MEASGSGGSTQVMYPPTFTGQAAEVTVASGRSVVPVVSSEPVCLSISLLVVFVLIIEKTVKRLNGNDIELHESSSKLVSDPYSFRRGLKSDNELAELRKRRKGKRLELFHRKQNDVCSL
jgi:hypothetical protein